MEFAPGTVATGQCRARCISAMARKEIYRMGTVAWRWLDDDLADLTASNTLHDARPHPQGEDDARWVGEPVERVLNR